MQQEILMVSVHRSRTTGLQILASAMVMRWKYLSRTSTVVLYCRPILFAKVIWSNTSASETGSGHVSMNVCVQPAGSSRQCSFGAFTSTMTDVPMHCGIVAWVDVWCHRHQTIADAPLESASPGLALPELALPALALSGTLVLPVFFEPSLLSVPFCLPLVLGLRDRRFFSSFWERRSRYSRSFLFDLSRG
ncbi:hypothetical protein PV04_03896 [Phialophora macrospora]|uniref:Uncharacterized protein n=1 Tax=Phialophora macrospora TaxID=1851006 RepID=A0A0D2EBU2_9EURO|nr:hypothetical protein PV04_03896 [Phialophora macrospora]